MATKTITKTQLKKMIQEAIVKEMESALNWTVFHKKESVAPTKKRPLLREGERHNFVEVITMSYLEACAWSSSDISDDEDGNQYESLDEFEFSPEAQMKASADVKAFVSMCEQALGKDIYQICQDNSQTLGNFGHDLWLTSAGHGAGFWDGGWEVDGDALTKLVNKSGLRDQDAYLGDDNLIYIA